MHQLDRIEAMLAEMNKKQEPTPLSSDLISAAWARQTIIALFEALNTDHKIEAIKAYRQLTGMGLKESKDAIENLYTQFSRRRVA